VKNLKSMLENSAWFPTDFCTPPSSPSACAPLAPYLILGRGVKAVKTGKCLVDCCICSLFTPERAINLGAFAADSGAEIGGVWDNG